MTTNDTFLGLLTGAIEIDATPAAVRPPIDAACHLKADRKPCPRCMGRGVIESFRHVKGGECFACEGSGDANHFNSRRVIYGADMVDAL